MSKLRALDEKLNLAEKKVILRVDLNVPMLHGKVTDESRIKIIIPIIKKLIKKKAKVILISHLGRPKGKIDQKLTLRPIVPILEALLNSKVYFIDKNFGPSVVEKSEKIKPGEVLLLENLRFNKEEELNEDSFAKELSKMGDIFINEAFSCSHRAHASVCRITNYIDSYAGELLIKEVNVIKMLTSNATKPIICIVGGSKISTKIGILNNLIKKTQHIAIVGAMANNFIKYKGHNIGKSLFEKNQEKIVNDILKQCEINNCNLILPEDVIVSKDHDSKGSLKSLDKINDTDLILDIGKKTIENICKKIDESKSLMFFISPADVRNTGFLTFDYDKAGKEDDQWMYLPALKKTKRIASGDKSGSFMGSDLNYSDMTSSDLDQYDYTLMKETEVRGKKVWQIMTVPRTRDEAKKSGYSKSIIFIRQDNYVMIRAVRWIYKKKRNKYLDIKKLEKIDGIWVSTEMHITTKSGKKTLHKTIFKRKNSRFNQGEITERIFSIRSLEKGL